MKLDPVVDTFLKYNAPKWYNKITGTEGPDEGLGYFNRCIVGELYGMTDNYLGQRWIMKDDGYAYSTRCDTCKYHSERIWASLTVIEHIRGGIKIGHLIRNPSKCRQAEFNAAVKDLAEHVKSEHPDMLKQEKPIEA